MPDIKRASASIHRTVCVGPTFLLPALLFAGFLPGSATRACFPIRVAQRVRFQTSPSHRLPSSGRTGCPASNQSIASIWSRFCTCSTKSPGGHSRVNDVRSAAASKSTARARSTMLRTGDGQGRGLSQDGVQQRAPASSMITNRWAFHDFPSAGRLLLVRVLGLRVVGQVIGKQVKMCDKQSLDHLIQMSASDQDFSAL